MYKEIRTLRVGVLGEEPLVNKGALLKTRDKFIEAYQYEPKQLRLSPRAFNELRAFAERYEYPFGFDVKVDDDLEDGQWFVCNEETKVTQL